MTFHFTSIFVITFLPRNKCVNFMDAFTICSDFGSRSKICHGFHFFPFYLPLSDGTGCHGCSFSDVEFQVSILTLFIHRQVPLHFLTLVSPAYLRLLIFLPAILIPACDSQSPEFCMVNPAWKLNKQCLFNIISFRITIKPTSLTMQQCWLIEFWKLYLLFY